MGCRSSDQRDTSKVKLVQQVNLIDCIVLVVGIIIGSGIFVSPKGILANTGTVGWALAVWVVSGVFTCIGALCYAELGTTIDKSGGDYTYLRIFQPVLGFLRVWTTILAVRTVPCAVLSITAAKYITTSVGYFICEDGISKAATQLMAGCILACIIYVNCWSVWLSRRLQIFFTIAKTLGLTIIILCGMWQLSKGIQPPSVYERNIGIKVPEYYLHTKVLMQTLMCLLLGTSCLGPLQWHTQNFQNAFDTEEVKWVQFPQAFYSGLFAYSGWQYLPQVTEEIIDPERNVPLSIIISVAAVMIIYISTNVAYFVVLSPIELLASDAVAVTFGQRVLGPIWWIMPIFVAMSCIGSINGVIFGTARMFFVASREGQLPDILGMIHIRRKTPLPAASFFLPICMVMLITDDVYALINYLSFSRWLFIAITVALVPYFRWKYPDLDRPFKVPLVLPVLFTFCALFMVVSSFLSAAVEFAIGFLITLAGIPVYLIFVWWEKKPKCFTNVMGAVTMFLQNLLLVVPQEEKTYTNEM